MLAHVLHSRTCVLRAHTVSTVPGLFILREARKQHTTQPSGSRKSLAGTKMNVKNFELILGQKQTCQPSRFWRDSPDFRYSKRAKSGMSRFLHFRYDDSTLLKRLLKRKEYFATASNGNKKSLHKVSLRRLC